MQTDSQQPDASPGSDPPGGYALPTASELRTAAKVLRSICAIRSKMEDDMPIVKRLWWKVTRENDDEILRKSAVLDQLADKMEAHNEKLSDQP